MSEVWDTYRRQGYFHARGVLPLAALDETTRDMNRVVTQQLSRLGLPVASDDGMTGLYANLKCLHRADLKAYLASLTLWAKLYSLHSLVMHPNLAALAREVGVTLPVFQTQPVMHLVSDQLLIPNGYQGFDVHQDWTALQSGLDTMGIWIPFVDIDRDLNTMEVIPGSHLQGLCEGTQGQHVYAVSPSCYREDDFVPVEVQRGDVFLMAIFTVHRSGKRGRPGALRLSCSARYENAAEPTFVERLYPFTQRRVVERGFLHPGFPTQEQVRKVYGA